MKSMMMIKYKQIVFLFLFTYVGFLANAFCLEEDGKKPVISAPVQSTACEIAFDPDLPTLESSDAIENEITAILEKWEDNFLGTSAPSETELNSALSKYELLNILVADGSISGSIVANNYNSVKFLKTFANHLRYQPNDSEIREKANNVVWLVTDEICKGLISTGGASALYNFDNFAKPAAFLSRHFNDTVRSLFANALYAHRAFDHFWEPVYDVAYQTINESISTDIMYILGDVLMVFAANQATPDERYLWMRGFQRWVERFASYSSGTANGIKPDGTGFHHWTAYDNYMYSFKTASNVIYYLSGTSFQIEKENYLIFRDAVYAQIVFANESRVKALSQCGRKPQSRDSQYAESSLKLLALAGGQILELNTADTILAGEYNRIFGVYEGFNYSNKAGIEQSSGFYQFNHANLGVFRKDNWLAAMKGFSNGLWGAELYPTSNRYGRYQSYGTLEIIYPGSLTYGNGFDVQTWNWNYNPGATTIVLPWDKLHGEKGRIDEYQKYGFAGALAFNNKNSLVLKKTRGTLGVFAMDFQEIAYQGFDVTYGPNTHNETFRFKKSTFVFDDMIVCLGSDINNNDLVNHTVTTLFQRIDNKSNDLIVNGNATGESSSLEGSTNNWIISNYKTGYYLVAGNNEVKFWNGEQQTPNYDQIDPSAYTNNKIGKYWIAYLDHGVNPEGAGYEYVVIPNATEAEMNELDSEFNAEVKPYTVYLKNSTGHIIEHNSGVWGYALFSIDTSDHFHGPVAKVSHPCLIMCENAVEDSTLKLAVSYPDLGFEKRSYAPAKTKVIEITLKGVLSITDTELSDVAHEIDGDATILRVTLRNGLPAEVNLKGVLRTDTRTAKKSHFPDKLHVYPNPGSDQVFVSGNFPENCQWRLYNSTGSFIKEGQVGIQSTKIGIGDLSEGIYHISIVRKNAILSSGVVIKK